MVISFIPGSATTSADKGKHYYTIIQRCMEARSHGQNQPNGDENGFSAPI
jgi:hypothetical protein